MQKMRRTILKTRDSTFILLLITVLLSGCAAVQGYPESPSAEPLSLLDKNFDLMIDEYFTLSGAEQRSFRDKQIVKRLAVIVVNFNTFEKALYQQTIRTNIGVQWLILALGGATIAVSSTDTKDILAATSVGILGAKAAFDKDALFDNTMPALLAQMRALRKEVQLKILQGQQKDTDRYSLTQAFRDLDEYYRAGTIPGAIVGVTKGSTDALAKADENLRLFESTFEVTPEGKTLKAYLYPDPNNPFVPDPSALANVQDEMTKRPPTTSRWV